MKEDSPSPLLVIIAFISIYLIWGGTYLFVAIALNDLPPFFLAGIRFILASLLIGIVLPFLKSSQRPSYLQVKNAFVAGILFLVLGNGGMSWALQYIDSGLAALIISAQPMVILLMLYVLQGQKIKLQSIIGVLLGILGIYLLVAQDSIEHSSDYWWGMLALVSCLFSWGYASIFVGKSDMPKNFFVNSALQMALAGIIMVVISFFTENIMEIRWSQISNTTIWAMMFLVIFGSIVAFTAFNYLLRHVSPEKVSTSTYVNPIVAMFLGWYFLNEPITLLSLVATGILLLGVFIINSRRFSRKGKRAIVMRRKS